MRKHIEKALEIVAAMHVNGDNQELAVMAKQELKAALSELDKLQHEYEVKKDG